MIRAGPESCDKCPSERKTEGDLMQMEEGKTGVDPWEVKAETGVTQIDTSQQAPGATRN